MNIYVLSCQAVNAVERAPEIRGLVVGVVQSARAGLKVKLLPRAFYAEVAKPCHVRDTPRDSLSGTFKKQAEIHKQLNSS